MIQPDVQQEEQAVTPAFYVCAIETLRKRKDFLAAAKAKRQHMPGFVIQARKRNADETDPQLIRVGYTCSKKVGNAVARNRAKRRLREIARTTLPVWGKPGHDYVLIGRAQETSSRDFATMVSDLKRALSVLHPKKS